MSSARKAKSHRSSASEVCTINEPCLLPVENEGLEQDECSQIFRDLRSDSRQLLKEEGRKSLMARIAGLRDKLNQKQIRLQEALLNTFNVKNGPIGSWVGPKISLETVEFPNATISVSKTAMGKVLGSLQKAGCCIRKIHFDEYSLFRAIAFGLIEKGVDMHSHFATQAFLVLPARMQRLLKESFERIKRNSTILQLEMEMNIQEISNGWVTFLRQLAVGQCENYGKNVSRKGSVKGQSDNKIQLDLIPDINTFRVMDMSLSEEFVLEVLSKQFNIPMQMVHVHSKMPRLKETSICLLQTFSHVDLLYP